MVTLPHDIPLNQVDTLEKLLERCPEANKVIRNAIENVLRTQAGRYTVANQQDAWVDVVSKLGQYLRGRYFGPEEQRPRSPITNQKFLTSLNRAGWLYRFAKNWTRNWLRERIRVAAGDARVKNRLQTGVTPAENFTEQQTREAAENNSLHFDRWQFANRVPRCETNAESDWFEELEPSNSYATPEFCQEFGSREPIEYQTASEVDAEQLALVKLEVSRFSPADQDFFLDYVGGYGQGGRSGAERVRFHRLLKRVKTAVA
jgi:hypothetical protein